MVPPRRSFCQFLDQKALNDTIASAAAEEASKKKRPARARGKVVRHRFEHESPAVVAPAPKARRHEEHAAVGTAAATVDAMQAALSSPGALHPIEMGNGAPLELPDL